MRSVVSNDYLAKVQIITNKQKKKSFILMVVKNIMKTFFTPLQKLFFRQTLQHIVLEGRLVNVLVQVSKILISFSTRRSKVDKKSFH